MNKMTVKELKQKLDSGEQLKVIDIREPYEVEIASIGAQHIPMGEIVDRKDELPKDQPVVIHCRSGKRSAAVIETLNELHGFDNLYNLKGGINAWAEEIDPDIPTY